MADKLNLKVPEERNEVEVKVIYRNWMEAGLCKTQLHLITLKRFLFFSFLFDGYHGDDHHDVKLEEFHSRQLLAHWLDCCN